MTKVKITNQQDLDSLLNELKHEKDSEISFQNEESPESFPCILIHHYSDDTDFGSLYNIEFVYPSDFN
jgi:hypothetical protein